MTDNGAAILVKVHRRIIPLLAACWFIAYIDRFNVGFAGLQMNADLGLSATAFGLGAGIFFLGYSVFEIPSNLILARVGARVWLARIMMTWGVLSAAAAFASGPTSFYVLRFLLGVAEAGCFPGIAFYLSQWLAPRQRTAALASIATMSMASGVAGGPLAAAFLAMDGLWGFAGWRWLFVMEGLPAVVLGMCLLRYLPDRPEQVRWLSGAEREWLSAQRQAPEAEASSVGALRTVLRTPKYWVWAAAFFCATAPGSALRLFQPTILKEMAGLGTTTAAILTAVPSLAGMMAIVYIGRRSTAMDERRWHAAIPMFVGALGLALVGITYGLVGALVVACLATAGVATQPPLFASVSAASEGPTRAVGIAFVNSVSALGAFVGPYAVGYLLDRSGSLASVCLMAGAMMAVGGLIVLSNRERAPVGPVVSVETV